MVKSKIYTLSKWPFNKNQSSKFWQSSVKQTHFKYLKKKGSDSFFIIGALTSENNETKCKY